MKYRDVTVGIGLAFGDCAMHDKHDQLAKALVASLLYAVARVEASRDIPSFVQSADLSVTPDESRASELRERGVLGRMVEMGPCLIEPFSKPPSLDDILACICKQHALNHNQRREAKQNKALMPPFPNLWIVSYGTPRRALKQLRMQPLVGWPTGFSVGREADPCYIVDVRKLPKTPDTVFLRLLGRGELFQEALHEVMDLTLGDINDSWPIRAVRQVLLAFREEFEQNPIKENNMQSVQEMAAAYDEWERNTLAKGHADGLEEGRRDGLEEGRRDGLKKGRREALEVLCEVLDIDITDKRTLLATWDIVQLERAIAAIRTSRCFPSD